MGVCGLGLSCSEQGPVAGCCEHGNGHSGSIKGGKFFGYLSDHKLLEDSVTWSGLIMSADTRLPTRYERVNGHWCRVLFSISLNVLQ
jgi:hypothetical protein